MNPRSVVVAHREAMVAEGIAAALARYPRILSAGVATDAEGAEHAAARSQALVIDRDLPGAEEVAVRLRARGVRVVFLGESRGEDDAVCVPTRATVGALASAIVPDPGGDGGALALTSREREILSLVAGGLAGKQVAKRLGISPKTVEQHKTRIFAKLGVTNQTAAVSFALACGLGRSHPWTRSST